jgi:cytochrome P450
MYDPFSEEARQDPYPIYTALREQCPVYWSPENSFYALARYADVHAALRDWRTYSSSGGPSRAGDLMDSDPPRHDEVRRLLAPRLGRASLEGVETATRESAEQLLDGRGARKIDLSRDFAQRLPALTVCRILGLPESDVPAAADAAVQLVWPAPTGDPVSVRMNARSLLTELFLTRVRERMGGRLTDDLIGGVARAVEHRIITLQDVAGLCLMFVTAGAEPTAGLLTNIIHALASSRVLPADLRDQRGRVRGQAIEEFLRHDAPVQWVSRFTTRTVTVGSKTIAPGQRVLLLIGSANRDPLRYDRPDELDLHRHGARGISFGFGVHACMGGSLARLQTRIALEVMLEQLPRLAVAGPAIRSRSHVVRGFERLPVHVA